MQDTKRVRHLNNWHTTPHKGGVLVYNDFSSDKSMIKPIDETHWEDLYARLHDAYVECMKHNNPTYEQKLAQVLDHMIINKKHLYIR